jgi:Flp pilus assembly protein TadD
MKNMKSVVRVRDKSGRTRQLSIDEALDEASRSLSAGEHGNALLLLEKAVRLAPFNARARHLLGSTQANAGNLKDATYNLNKAVEADPNNADFRTALAQALMPASPTDAIPHFLTAILLGSTRPDVFANLASILLGLRRYEDALKVCDLSLAACQEQFAILESRSVALYRLGRPAHALACCRRQEELQPGNFAAWSNMGVILKALGRLAESEKALRHARLLAPTNSEVHYNLAITLLASGQYHEGFREYEWRWQTAVTKREPRNFTQPLWDGSFLGTKHILLLAEQGAGDTIQFVRYLPLMAKLGGQIVLAVPPSLVRIMSWLEGQHHVIPLGLVVGGFDTRCPLMSLARLFGTELESIPPPASFIVPAALCESWIERLAGDKPKVAFVWAGNPEHNNNRHRSLPLHSFLPLIGVGDLDFFSLQVGPPAQELHSAELANRIRDLSPFLTDFAETAAALSGLDLLITADTAVAHLAASLGKPVWMLLPFDPDWRWLLNRTDSPWYPSMRLFRQQTQGDWETVIAEILIALQVWLLAERPE